MIEVGIVVGIHTDAIDPEKIEELYPYLEEMPDKFFKMSKEKWGPGDYGLGSDMATAYYMIQHSPKNMNITLLTNKDISVKKFNEYDFVVGLYDQFYHYTHTKNIKQFNRFNDVVKKSKATFLQPLSLSNYILDKTKYMNDLKKIGLPIVDTLSFPLNGEVNPKTMISKIEKKCLNEWNMNSFITKPEMVGFGSGFKKWNLNDVLENPKKFNEYVKQMKSMGYPKLLAQYFVQEFEQRYEVRTYWFNGKYSHSIGTIIDPDSLGKGGFEKIKFAYPENEFVKDFPHNEENDKPEILDQKLVNSFKKMGKKVFDIIPKDKTGLPFVLRIDFGCCLNNHKLCRDYFINEIEYLPNLFPDYSPYKDPCEESGKALLSKIKTLS